MKEQITAKSFREKTRQNNENFSKFIDQHYNSFFEVAKYMQENNLPATRIETPFGDYVILVPKV